jgi:branched-chain amino acid transport system ATP-binding protein
MLDEPLAGVNRVLREELLEQILATREREGITILLIEHDLESVMATSDTVAVMNQGKVIFVGLPGEVQANEAVVDAYLGARHTRNALGSTA